MSIFVNLGSNSNPVDAVNNAVQHTDDVFRRIASTFFSVHSIVILIASLALALLFGRLVAFILRKVVVMIGGSADKSQNLHTVNRLRRYETLLVLSIAVIRTALVLFAIYFWWVSVHPNNQPSAILGAGAVVALILSGTLSPALRDITAGSLMMAEQWYGVGDHVKIEPFTDLQGVVERVTLRSTKVRGLNGESVWVNNQYVQAVRVASKGVRRMALDLFVTDIDGGRALVEAASRRLPIGPFLLIAPLEVVSVEEVGEKLWHMVAIGNTAPGREWLIEKSAVELIKSLDDESGKPIIAYLPLARFADIDAESKFTRTISNARKKAPVKRAPLTRAERAEAKSAKKSK